MLFVLPPQFFDLSFQILIALQHAPKSNISSLRQRSREVGLPSRVFAAVLTDGSIGLLGATNLLLEPDVLFDQFLVALLALLKVVELVSSAVVSLSASQ